MPSLCAVGTRSPASELLSRLTVLVTNFILKYLVIDLTAINNTLSEFNDKINNNKKEIEDLRADFTQFDTRLAEVERNCASVKSTDTTSTLVNSTHASTLSIYNLSAELQDRLYRSLNILIYNLPASND